MRAAAADFSMRCAIPRPIISWRFTRAASRGPLPDRIGQSYRASHRRPTAGLVERRHRRTHRRTPASRRTARCRQRQQRHRSRQLLRFNSTAAPMKGVAGDTLASALLANGVHLTGRSFKYHRPRGILAAGSEEPNALVTVRRDAARVTPNLRATQVELYDGLIAESQNRWPSLSRDFGRINDALSRVLPGRLLLQDLHVAAQGLEGAVRAGDSPRGGLGPRAHRRPIRTAMRSAMPIATYWSSARGLPASRRHWPRPTAAPGSCSAMRRRSSAAACSRRRGALIDGRPALDWVWQSMAALSKNPRVTLLARTTAFGYFPHNFIGLNQRLTDHLANPPQRRPRERLWQVRARQRGARHRRHRAPVGISGQRSAGNFTGGRRPYLSQSLRRAGRHARRRGDLGDEPYAAGPRFACCGRAHCAPSRICDPRPPAPSPTPRAAPGSTCFRDRPCSAPPAICACRPITLGSVDGATVQSRAAHSLRYRADVRRLHAQRAFVFSIARQAAVERRSQGFRAGRLGGMRALSRRLPRNLRSGRSAGGRGGGRRRGRARSRAARRRRCS